MPADPGAQVVIRVAWAYQHGQACVRMLIHPGGACVSADVNGRAY